MPNRGRNKHGESTTAIEGSLSGVNSRSGNTQNTEHHRAVDRPQDRSSGHGASFLRDCRSEHLTVTPGPVEGMSTVAEVGRRPGRRVVSTEPMSPARKLTLEPSLVSTPSGLLERNASTQPLLETPEGFDRIEESWDVVEPPGSGRTHNPTVGEDSHGVSLSPQETDAGGTRLPITPQPMDSNRSGGTFDARAGPMHFLNTPPPPSAPMPPPVSHQRNRGQEVGGVHERVRVTKRSRSQDEVERKMLAPCLNKRPKTVLGDVESSEEKGLVSVERETGNILPVAEPTEYQGEKDEFAPVHIAVGARVEVLWKGEWSHAVVLSREKEGCVRVRMETDGSTLYIEANAIRRSKAKEDDRTLRGNSERKGGENVPCRTVSCSGAKPPLARCERGVPSPEFVTPEKKSTKPREQGIGRCVHPRALLISVSRGTQACLTDGAESVLENLVKSGLVLVRSPSELQEECETLTSAREEHSCAQQCLKHLRGVRFVVVPAKGREGMSEMDDVGEAHAMGVSAVSVRWLERLHADGSWDEFRVSLPNPEEVVNQRDDGIFRCSVLRQNRRFFSRQLVYVPVKEPFVERLIELCGGKVTRELSQDNGSSTTISAPCWAYVECTEKKLLLTGHPTVKSLDLRELRRYIDNFFADLPSSFSDQDDCTCYYVRNASVANSNRLVEDGPRHSVINGESPPAEVEGENPAFQLFGRPCDYPIGSSHDISQGEDYYFRSWEGGHVPQTNEAPPVALGRVLAVDSRGASERRVTMRLYRMSSAFLTQNPYTGDITRHQSVYLGPDVVHVMESDLIFDTSLLIFSPSEMQHVYVLEQPHS